MNPTKLPEDLLACLLNRGHSVAAISEMTADDVFDEFCNWHGLIGWGSTLRNAMDAANAASQ